MKFIITPLLLCLFIGAFGQGSIHVENVSQCDYEITFWAQNAADGCAEAKIVETYISGDVRATTFTGCPSCEITHITICSNAGGCCIAIAQPSNCVHCTSPYGPAPSSFVGQICPADPCELMIYWTSCGNLVIDDL